MHMKQRSKTCEMCRNYRMIDSGYGHCVRNPPQPVSEVTGNLFFGIKTQVHWDYPCVGFDELTCSQFLDRDRNNRSANRRGGSR